MCIRDRPCAIASTTTGLLWYDSGSDMLETSFISGLSLISCAIASNGGNAITARSADTAVFLSTAAVMTVSKRGPL
eukprot:5121913-Pyramimonas_sp.AAC.1